MNPLTETHSPSFYMSFDELCHCANMSAEFVLELVEYDIAVPVKGSQPQEWQFNITTLKLVDKAARLRRDLELDSADLALVLTLLGEIDTLKAENAQLKQHLQRFLVQRN